MSLTVAIVGRPNVGKSTLFNRLAGRRLALVDETPGVTRDRREGRAQLGDLTFTIVDTAGIEETADGLAGRMRAQTESAIVAADVVLFVVDARTGLTPDDHAFARLLRRFGKPVILVANKSEGRIGLAGAYEAFALGFDDPVAISAEHGEGLADLYDALRTATAVNSRRAREGEGADQGARADAEEPATSADTVAADEPENRIEKPIRIAVVGRPNAGKSTLINRLLGEDRLLTGPEPGITRDAIAVPFEWHGRHFLVHDTAGLRRRSRVEGKLEKLAVADTLTAIRFADVAILVIDATAPFEEQDLRIADLVEREGRALVLAVNKWDLREGEQGGQGGVGRLRAEADHWLPQVKGVPIVAVSGLTGRGLDRLIQAALDIHAVWNRRVPTTPLNRWLEAATSAHPPPAVSGRRLKLNYITQPKARPPSFVLFCSRADALPEAYRRYLVGGLRETFDLPGVPIRLTLREKANPFVRRGVRR